jgi:hypothetical protein
MKNALSAGVVLASFACAGAASAQEGAVNPPNIPLHGTVTPAFGSPDTNAIFCQTPSAYTGGGLIYGAPSVFSRNGAGNATFIFEPIDYFVAPVDTVISGTTVLEFTTATTGIVKLPDVPAYGTNVNNGGVKADPTLKITFKNYTQAYASGILKVSFDMVLPKCTLPISAIYRNLG